MTQTISQTLLWGKRKLRLASNTATLDTEVLLAHVLQVERGYLYAFPEAFLEETAKEQFEKLILKRMLGEPIAYLTGHQEFWSLDLVVTPDTLIPRPETELLVELVLQNVAGENKLIADLGVGAGAIALSIAHERPTWTVHASDASCAALGVAQFNARRLSIKNVVFHQGLWCKALPKINFDAIVSNPPYIAKEDAHLWQGNLHYEPRAALISDMNGLQDIQRIITEARDYLKPGGYLIVEHGFQQAMDVQRNFKKIGYTEISSYKDLSKLDRVTLARWF